mmetsp:Transcript_3190/g.500  ORF Transcript_3190/g.500 Transcript_3190/m.500 type:complete len:116 (-) Transcript_3190:472-819(-)
MFIHHYIVIISYSLYLASYLTILQSFTVIVVFRGCMSQNILKIHFINCIRKTCFFLAYILITLFFIAFSLLLHLTTIVIIVIIINIIIVRACSFIHVILYSYFVKIFSLFLFIHR